MSLMACAGRVNTAWPWAARAMCGRAGAAGAKALIVDGGRCALIGGYGPERDRVRVGSLTAEGFVPDAVGVLKLPGGAELGRRRFVGRGAELHAFVGNRWYKIAVADFLD